MRIKPQNQFIEIETDKPLPSSVETYADLIKRMDVGNSVVITKAQYIAMRRAAYRIGCRLYMSGQGVENGKVRVWLVSKPSANGEVRANQAIKTYSIENQADNEDQKSEQLSNRLLPDDTE